MTNAEKFKQFFGIYATELWAMPEEKFLEWLNAEVLEKQEQSCDTCKYGRFGDEACINCRVGFPSHYKAEDEA